MTIEGPGALGDSLEGAPAGNGKRTILVVDDAELNRDLLELQLQDEFTILKAADGREALSLLQKHYKGISLMLLDLVMPNMDGEELLGCIQGNPLLSSVPVVVMTSEDSAEMESHCLELGASDFIRKPFDPFILHHRVRSLIRLHEADSALAAIERDAVTSLYNKEAFLHYAKDFIAAHRDEELCVVLSQIEDFAFLEERYGLKKVNDHLRACGALLNIPEDRGLVGYAEDGRFISVNVASGVLSVTWLRKTIGDFLPSSPIPSAKTKFVIYEDIPKDRELMNILRTATAKMKDIEQSFDTDIALLGAADERALERRHKLIADMGRSLANGDFHIVYQPKHDAASGRLCGAEALVRWNHPELGPVSPGEFIPLFEENGSINQLDTYVHVRVYRTMRAWLDAGLPVVPVSANFSKRDLLDDSYISYLVGVRHDHPDDVPARLLHAEVTESMLCENCELLTTNLRRLSDVGYDIELDDFGSGYSNLALMAELPLNTIKLDMSLIRTLDAKEPVVRHCIELAHDLGLTVVAEGVETEGQLAKLRELGCDTVQGYCFSRPLPADEFVAYLKAHA